MKISQKVYKKHKSLYFLNNLNLFYVLLENAFIIMVFWIRVSAIQTTTTGRCLTATIFGGPTWRSADSMKIPGFPSGLRILRTGFGQGRQCDAFCVRKEAHCAIPLGSGLGNPQGRMRFLLKIIKFSGILCF